MGMEALVMAMVFKLLRFLLLVIIAAFFVILRSGDAQTWTLDDFEDGDLRSAAGLSWIVIADDLAGGATAARHTLRLGGKLGGGAVSFAGAWASLERSGRSLDLSAFEGVRLRVKGPARLEIGFRSGPVNFMARVDAGPEWQLVEIP